MNSRIIASASLGAALALGALGTPAHANDGSAGSQSDAVLSQLAFGETNLTGGRALSNEELSESRGGYGGIFFSLFGYGDINQVGGTLPDGVSIDSQSADLVSMNVGLANLPNTGGFVQFASVVGNNNIVNNNLILNVYFLEGGVADTSSLTNGSMFGL